MATNEEVNELHLAVETAWLSSGYLSVCSHMVEAIENQDFDRDPGRDLAVLFLLHHALELYFKAALRAAGGKAPQVHSLGQLSREYKKHYAKYPVTIPRCLASLSDVPADLFANASIPLSREAHQRLRYAADRNGKMFSAIPDFDAAVLSDDLAQINKQTASVLVAIIHGDKPK